MVKLLGYHDAYASGVIHAIAGGAALGVLVHLGPRIGKFRKDGTARDIAPHHPWLVTIGLFLIYTGFWGFYVACNVPIIAEADIGATGNGLYRHQHLSHPDNAVRDCLQLPDVALRRHDCGATWSLAATRFGPIAAALPASSRHRQATTSTTRSRRC